MEFGYRQIYEDNKLVLTEIHDSVSNLKDTSAYGRNDETVTPSETTLEEQKQVKVLEAVKSLTEIKPKPQRTVKENITVVVSKWMKGR